MRFVFFILLLFLSVSFAENTFGSSNVTMTKTWIIHCPGGGCTAEFEGLLVINNSNQKVVSIITEPEMDIVSDEYGEIHVFYNEIISGNSLELKATADVEVDYNTHILDDPPLNEKNINSTELTEPDGKIIEKADELADSESTLNTIRNVVGWVNENIEYDISYFGQSRDAQNVKTFLLKEKGFASNIRISQYPC